MQNRIKPDYLDTKQLAWLKRILTTSVLNIQIPCLRLLRTYPTESNLSFYLHACINVPWTQNTTHVSIFVQRRVAWCITMKCNLIHTQLHPSRKFNCWTHLEFRGNYMNGSLSHITRKFLSHETIHRKIELYVFMYLQRQTFIHQKLKWRWWW